jgi:carbon-monoxide dehydrogenase medium subunit
MKPPQFDYVAPETVAEAVHLKALYEGEAAVLAGGQSLVPMLNFRLARPAALIDLRRIRGLDAIRVDGSNVRVGAMTRQRDLERHKAAAAACPVVERALQHVAHPVIRNRGTVGGSVAHADAAAELPVTLIALDGSVRVAGTTGERTIPADELFEFHLTTSLKPDELIVEVTFPSPAPNAGSSFLEVSRRHGDYAIVGVCAVIRMAEDETIDEARLAYAGIAQTPVRATAAEHLLAGSRLDDAALAAAADAAASCVDAIDEEQATVAYRRQLVRALTRRTLQTASADAHERAPSQ